MARFRRPAVMLMAAAATIAAAVGEIKLSGTNGNLRIANDGSSPVEFRTALTLERRAGDEWVNLAAKVYAVRSCTAPAKPTVTIAAHSTLDIVRWRGFACSGQCQTACRADAYYGPGPFRFRSQIIGGGSIAGPAFNLPLQPSANLPAAGKATSTAMAPTRQHNLG